MKPEILAPAGSMEALKAAVHAGADAVYLGGARFGARAFAGNFDEAALIEGIEYSHLQGVKVYLTVNTLFRDEELGQLSEYLKPYYEAGLDAAIVQDFGVMRHIHAHFPELPIHASTQMTITTERAYPLLAGYGVTRIVPARELTIAEIARLKSVDPVPEVEVFVQGALCYCYSGLCLMSSMLGGRSGNRGRCAQTCRLPYAVYDREGKQLRGKGDYVLSPKDLCGLNAVPDLIRAGVDSFKIEGRMKKPEYVAACTRAYRRAVDACEAGSFTEELVEQCRREMAEVFNRGGFTKGYFAEKKQMMSVREPGNAGVRIGKIEQLQKNRVGIRLETEVFQGDILELKAGKEKITLTSPSRQERGTLLVLNAPRARELRTGQPASRVLLYPLEQELHRLVVEQPPVRLEGRIELQLDRPALLHLSADIRNRHFSVTQTGEPVMAAQSKALDRQTVADKIGRMGENGFVFGTLDIDLQDGVFFPLSALKELRRRGLAALKEEILSADRRRAYCPEEEEHALRKAAGKETAQCQRQEVPEEEPALREAAGKKTAQSQRQEVPEEEPALREAAGTGTEQSRRQERKGQGRQVSAMVSSMEQYDIVRSAGWLDAVYVDLQYFPEERVRAILEERGDVIVALPVILRGNAVAETVEICTLIRDRYPEVGVAVRNVDELALLKQMDFQGTVVADYSLYMMNRESLAFLRQQLPQASFTYPVELNRRQLKLLAPQTYTGQKQTGTGDESGGCKEKSGPGITAAGGELVVYGYQQLMASAQCLSSTLGRCDRQNRSFVLKDRYQKDFFAQNICKYCYSLIYNGLPTVLYDQAEALFGKDIAFRLHFTREDARQTKAVLDAFLTGGLPEGEKTRGHFNRGVE